MGVASQKKKKKKKKTMENMSIYSWGACRHFPDMEDHGRYGSIRDACQGGLRRIVFWFCWSVSRIFKFNECTHVTNVFFICLTAAKHTSFHSETWCLPHFFCPSRSFSFKQKVSCNSELSNKELEVKGRTHSKKPTCVLYELNPSCSAINQVALCMSDRVDVFNNIIYYSVQRQLKKTDQDNLR